MAVVAAADARRSAEVPEVRLAVMVVRNVEARAVRVVIFAATIVAVMVAKARVRETVSSVARSCRRCPS